MAVSRLFCGVRLHGEGVRTDAVINNAMSYFRNDGDMAGSMLNR